MLSVLSIHDFKQGAIYDEAASLRTLAVVLAPVNFVRSVAAFAARRPVRGEVAQ